MGMEKIAKARKAKRGRRQLLFLIAVVVIGIFVGTNALEILKLRDEAKAIDEQLVELEMEKTDLGLKLNNITNTQFIEQMARDTLKMAKPGETIYILKGNENPLEKDLKDEAKDKKSANDKVEKDAKKDTEIQEKKE